MSYVFVFHFTNSIIDPPVPIDARCPTLLLPVLWGHFVGPWMTNVAVPQLRHSVVDKKPGLHFFFLELPIVQMQVCGVKYTRRVISFMSGCAVV